MSDIVPDITSGNYREVYDKLAVRLTQELPGNILAPSVAKALKDAFATGYWRGTVDHG